MADEKKGIITEFKEFILRGNVVDLAVAVVMGAAFTAVVTSLVSNIFTPLIAAIFGKPTSPRCTSPSTRARSPTGRSSTP